MAQRFGVAPDNLLLPDLVTPTYNLAPSQPAMVVRASELDRKPRLFYMTWGLLVPYKAEDMVAWPVNRRVGNPAVNDPALIKPIKA